MATTLLTIKVDDKDKKKAQKLAKELGFTLSDVVRADLKKFLREKRVDVGLELTDWAKEQLRQSEKDSKAGYVSPSFDNAEDAIKWLEDPKARYQNGRPVQ